MIEIRYMEIRERIFCDYGYRETMEHITNNIDKEDNDPVHGDLFKKLHALKPHVAVHMNYQQALLKADAPELDDLEIIGVDFGNGSWCIIKAKMRMPYTDGKMALVFPKISYDLQRELYPFMDKLKKAVEDLQDEVLQFHNGKYGDGAQLELELSDANVGADGSIKEREGKGKNAGKAKGGRRKKGGEGDNWVEEGI
jgi:hypothetical protein